ncbi:MAG: hypothetical protein L3J83_02240 [Proteobacteria bacterium]|nr:hypothetical protein [Pseudomonadota bacterium]
MIDLLADKNFTSSKLPENFFHGLSELFLELGIDGHEFIEDFTRCYLLCASGVYDKSTDVYSATGFSEYMAKKHLKDSAQVSYPKRKQYYRSLINEIKDLCLQSTDGTIPIYGQFSSFNSAFSKSNATDNTVTALSTLKKLIKAGLVEKVDNKRIKFITSLPTSGLNNKDDTLKLFANLIYRITGTVLHNLLAKNDEETLFQMSYFSKAVHPDNKRKLTDELRKEQRKDFRKYQKIIDSYEEKGFMRKRMEGQNEEIGLTSLIFNTQMRSKL